MPTKYGNISEIAQYNRENGTNFYTMEQVNKHKAARETEAFQKQHPFLSSIASARDAKIGAVGADQVRDLYSKGENELASEINKSYLGANATGIMSAPLGTEVLTYGPVAAGLRFGAGSAAGAVGSTALGAAGDYADKKLNTNFLGTTGRILGGFAGFGAGMKATTPLLQRAAARNITLGIPKETFVNLRKEGLSSEVARALNREIRTSDLTVPSSYFHNPNSAYRATTTREIADLSHTGTTRPSFKSKLADHDYSQGYQGWLKGDNYMEIVENSKNPFTKAKHSNLLGNEGVILETDGTGKLFRHGYHGSAGELEPFENIDTTPGELVTSGFGKGMYKTRKGGYGEAFTFKGLALGPEDPGISSDAISYFTRAGKGRWKYQGAIPRSKEITINPTLKQTRVVSEGTYPLYTGPKHSVTEVVNPDGTINPRTALRIEREVADNIPGAYRMESRLENPEWHVNDPNTWAHTRNVAQSAWTVPTPKGLTKQDQMIAALGHDFGKMVSGDGHAQSSAALIEQIFPDVTEQQLTAISEHMGAPKSILGKITKQADILNGKPAITRFVEDNGKIRLRLPSHTVEKPRELVLDPQGNNKFRVHTRTWDGDHIPAEMSAEDKNTLFNALYEELPEGAEILFPESGPGNYATRGTVASLQRLARDSRFKPTDNDVLRYVDKDGSIKTFEGTGFRKQKSIKLVSRPISEAERLGIPKGERSNPKALEDPQYWGYQQWNDRYNSAVESGNIEEVQKLRDLHFKTKSPNAPQHDFYHGTFNKEKPFYIFEPQSNNELFFHFSPYKDTAEKFMGTTKTRNENGRLITAKLNIQRPTTVTDSGWWNWYRIPEANPRISKKLGMDGPTAGQYYNDLLLKEPSISEANGKMMDMIDADAFMYKNYTEDTGRISIAVPRPTQIKLSDPITRTKKGEIIPIVKRDNFYNRDIRYKQGGILKAQDGNKLNEWINNWYKNRNTQFNNYVMFDSNEAIKRSNSIKEKYEPWDKIQSIIPKSNNTETNKVGGYYQKSTNTIYLPNTYKKVINGTTYEEPINPLSLNPSTYVHEKAHGIFDWEQKDQIEGILGNQMKDKYYDSPTEVNSRLMEVRYLNGFDPKHIFNKQEVERLKKDPNFKDRNIFNRYAPETVVRLLNEVAFNNSSKPNLIQYSKEGGIIKAQGGLGKIPGLGKFLKDKAYTIITDPNVWWKGGANKEDIKNALLKKTPDASADNNKYMFIYGADKLRNRTSDGEAYTWENDIKKNNYQNVESFEGTLNPYNEYLVNDRDKGLVEELAKHKYSVANNINDEYTDPETGRIAKDTPYYDDAHVYRLVFHNDNGKPVISASDLYDFGKNYTSGFSELYKERGGEGNATKRLESQRRWLNRVGKPYKLVQKNIPIRFVDNPQGNEINRVNNFTNVFDRMSDKDIAKALGNGMIEPAIISVHKQGGILKAEDGLKMIKYRQTENMVPEFEMPKIEGYKKQFSFQQPQGVRAEEIVIEEPEPEVKEEPEFSERELEVLQTDGTAQEKAEITNKYLQKRLGLTNEQAAALVGVWKAESGFNLNAENAEEKAGRSKYVKPTEYGIGIGQWTKSRHNDYVNYIKNNGGRNNLQTQLDFAIDEIQNKYSDFLNNLRTAENVQDATAYTYTQYVGGNERNIRDLDDLYARVRNMEQRYANTHREMYGKAGSGNFDKRVRFATESLLAKLGTKLPDIRKPEA